MDRPKVAVIVLNWNGLADTLGCLESLRGLRYPNFATFVVDNGSEDGSADALQELEGEITLIRSPENTGYAGGNNLAIAAATQTDPDFFWLLNNDCVVDPESLDRLVDFASATASAGLISPAVHSRENPEAIQQIGYLIDRRNRTLIERNNLEPAQRDRADSDRIAVSGAAVFASRATLSDIGLFDERYFAYWEDIDLSQRALSSGYRNFYLPDAKVFHRSPYIGGRINRKPYYYYYMCRNFFLFWRKSLHPLSFVSLLRSHLVYTLQQAGECLAHGNREGLEACLDGAWAAWSGHYGKWDTSVRMPATIRSLLLSHPFLALSLLKGDLKGVVDLIAAKARRKKAP